MQHYVILKINVYLITFVQIKNNMNYDRIRRRGLNKVSAEMMLMCFGVNIRRYFFL